MRFWDSSAVVLLVEEKASSSLTSLWKSDPHMFVWWGTEVECVSALTRLERMHALQHEFLLRAFSRLQRYANGWNVVQPMEILKETAKRLLRVHPLSAADALQLAAAIADTRDHGPQMGFVCLDARLADAAKREGFNVIGA